MLNTEDALDMCAVTISLILCRVLGKIMEFRVTVILARDLS